MDLRLKLKAKRGEIDLREYLDAKRGEKKLSRVASTGPRGNNVDGKEGCVKHVIRRGREERAKFEWKAVEEDATPVTDHGRFHAGRKTCFRRNADVSVTSHATSVVVHDDARSHCQHLKGNVKAVKASSSLQLTNESKVIHEELRDDGKKKAKEEEEKEGKKEESVGNGGKNAGAPMQKISASAVKQVMGILTDGMTKLELSGVGDQGDKTLEEELAKHLSAEEFVPSWQLALTRKL